MPEIFINEETRCHISARITIELIANEADDGHGEICRASAICRSGDVFDIDRGFKLAETRLVKNLRRCFPALDDHMNLEALKRSKQSRAAIWAVLLDWNRRRKLEGLKLTWAEIRPWNPKWLDWNRFLRIMTGEKQKLKTITPETENAKLRAAERDAINGALRDLGFHCDERRPCAHDYMCRIHRARRFLRLTGAPQTSAAPEGAERQQQPSSLEASR